MDKIRESIPASKQHVLDEVLLNYQAKMFKGEVESTEAEGKHYNPGFEAETALYARDKWEGMREDDVYVATYPKTGTNWTVDTINRILLIKDPSMKSAKELCGKFWFQANVLEGGPVKKFEVFDLLQQSRRRVIFTHVDGETFPINKAIKKGAKIIYVLRNPKDQTVSWYHFSNKLSMFKNNPAFGEDWKHFTEQYFAGNHPTAVRKGEWYPEHILSWYKHKNQPNVKFIYFEDMKKDFKKEIRGIAEFLNIELTDEEVVTVAHDCSFETKKKEQTESGSRIEMLRKGGVGGWKDYFTVAQSEAIDAEFADKLANTDITFTYEL